MAFNKTTNHFTSPLLTALAPTAYYVRRLLDVIADEFPNAITWYNDRWASAMRYTLVSPDPLSFHILPTKDLNARAVYGKILSDTRVYDANNFQVQVIEVAICYATGDDILDAPTGSPTQEQLDIASRSNLALIASYYGRVIEAIIEGLQVYDNTPTSATPITSNWPIPHPTYSDKGTSIKVAVRTTRVDLDTNYIPIDERGVEVAVICQMIVACDINEQP